MCKILGHFICLTTSYGWVSVPCTKRLVSISVWVRTVELGVSLWEEFRSLEWNLRWIEIGLLPIPSSSRPFHEVSHFAAPGPHSVPLTTGTNSLTSRGLESANLCIRINHFSYKWLSHLSVYNTMPTQCSNLMPFSLWSSLLLYRHMDV